MTSELDSSSTSTGDRARAWAYQRDFWPGIIGYGVVLAAVAVWGGLDGDSPWRFLWAVLPVLPVLWVVRAGVRHLRRIDEFQRLRALEGLALGFVVAILAAMTLGFLDVARLRLPVASGWIVVAVGMVGWAVGTGVLMLRDQRG